MKRTFSLILFFLLFLSSISLAQKISIPSLSLTGVDFNIKATSIPDSISEIPIKFINKYRSFDFVLHKNRKTVDTTLSINNAGNYKVILPASNETISEVRVIPGWLSIIPPLIAILLALIIRHVLVSLAAGIYIGAIFLYDFNPVIAFLRFADTIVIKSLTNPDHMFIITFTLLIGGVVGVISSNGGTTGLAKVITKYAKSAKSGMIASWVMGIAIFFDDYANSLIIGNMMRPITDKLRISREKLAYIVDSTAAPIASIVIISTWIGYELGLIGEGLRSIGSTENAYDVFLKTIPYRFYPIAALFFVFIVSYFQRDFGPMFKAEKRARETGKLTGGDEPIKKIEMDNSQINIKKNSKWFNGAIPILIILLGTIAGLIYTGVNAIKEIGSLDFSVRNIISNSNSYSALLWSSFAAGIVAIIMSIWEKLLSLTKAMDAWFKGIQSMFFAALILVFAWGISSITNELKTADYLISILSNSIDPRYLPVLVFLVCALISFATGTSWGTMAIVMPIVIPLAHKISVIFGLSTVDSTLIIHGVISSVLTGSVFGDHCSPIADTTILSSLASSCNHIDHVRTQLPYAILVAVVCMMLGDLPTAFGLNPYIAIIAILTVLTLILYFFGKKVPEFVEL